MKSIIFDTGPVISLTSNNLLWLLDELKKRYKGDFLITPSIKKELVERPLEINRFKFEALQVMASINSGVLNVFESEELRQKVFHLLDLANNSFKAKGNPIQIIHFAELSGIAAAVVSKAEAFVVDERNTRLLVENPEKLVKLLTDRLHTHIKVDRKRLNEFREICNGVKLIRSVELVVVAYELGLLDRYLADMPEPKKTLLESVLWALKISGCTVSEDEIMDIITLEMKKGS